MKERNLEKVEEPTGENPQERTARELIELLNELRVILPGVQVLFAFLLTVPFTQRFPQLDDLETAIFFMTLLCTAVATALLIAPSAHHRWAHRPRACDGRGGIRDHRLHLRPDRRCYRDGPSRPLLRIAVVRPPVTVPQ